MAREIKNVAASAQARLRNVARETGTDFQILLSRYVLERLLYRLSVSPHRNRFILKGALLFPLWLDDPFRPTRDLDLLGFGDSRPAELADVFREIMSVGVPDDGVVFDTGAVQAAAIRDQADYDGVRVRTEARIGNARIPVQVDVGFGDAVFPAATEVAYPVLLEAPVPRIRAYPRETVVAEKFEALISLGGNNSRMKDFYDLWAMSEQFAFDGAALAESIRATFARRGTDIPDDIPSGLSEELASSPEKEAQWRAFTQRGRLAAQPGTFPEVISRLRDFLMPAAHAAKKAEQSAVVWEAGGPWRRQSG
jgi:predicted nucleotidyltransferase component of viral defense system